MAMMNTRIVSAFFDYGDGALPATVTVSGTAVIGFNSAGTRKFEGPTLYINVMLLKPRYFYYLDSYFV